MSAHAAAPSAAPAGLAEAERADAHLLVVRGSQLAARVQSRPRVRRTLGLRHALRLAALRGRAEWALPGPRRAAVHRAAVLLGPGAPPADVRRFARTHLVELAMQGELTWRPRDARRMPVRGLEHLEAARRGGGPTILTTVHVGTMVNAVYALAARGHTLYLAGGRRADEPPLEGAAGRWVRRQNMWTEQMGSRFVHIGGGAYAVMLALLERGELCWMNWDPPGGSLPIRFLGRTVHVRRGLASLALRTGAPVLPVFGWREGPGQATEILPPLDPSDHPDEATLNAALAATLEAAIRPRLAQAQPIFVRYLQGLGPP